MPPFARSVAVTALSLAWMNHVTIGAVAADTLPVPMGVIGTDGRQPIRDLPNNSWIRTLASPVGKLTFVNPSGQSFSCTGFILSHEFIATNYHCAHEDDGTPRTAKTIVMGFLGGGEGGTITDLKPAVVEASGDLDYAIVAFDKWTTMVPVQGRVTLSGKPPVVGDDLILIGHPRGRPLEVSQEGCRAVQEDQFRAALAHTCDSEPGSSGSPIFDAETGRVVAINFGGYEDGRAPNVATPIASIAAVSPIISSLLPNDRDTKIGDTPQTIGRQDPLNLSRFLVVGLVFTLSVCMIGLALFVMARQLVSPPTTKTRSRSQKTRPRKSRRSQNSTAALFQFFEVNSSRNTKRRPRAVTLGR